MTQCAGGRRLLWGQQEVRRLCRLILYPSLVLTIQQGSDSELTPSSCHAPAHLLTSGPNQAN